MNGTLLQEGRGPGAKGPISVSARQGYGAVRAEGPSGRFGPSSSTAGGYGSRSHVDDLPRSLDQERRRLAGGQDAQLRQAACVRRPGSVPERRQLGMALKGNGVRNGSGDLSHSQPRHLQQSAPSHGNRPGSQGATDGVGRSMVAGSRGLQYHSGHAHVGSALQAAFTQTPNRYHAARPSAQRVQYTGSNTSELVSGQGQFQARRGDYGHRVGDRDLATLGSTVSLQQRSQQPAHAFIRNGYFRDVEVAQQCAPATVQVCASRRGMMQPAHGRDNGMDQEGEDSGKYRRMELFRPGPQGAAPEGPHNYTASIDRGHLARAQSRSSGEVAVDGKHGRGVRVVAREVASAPQGQGSVRYVQSQVPGTGPPIHLKQIRAVPLGLAQFHDRQGIGQAQDGQDGETRSVEIKAACGSIQNNCLVVERSAAAGTALHHNGASSLGMVQRMLPFKARAVNAASKSQTPAQMYCQSNEPHAAPARVGYSTSDGTAARYPQPGLRAHAWCEASDGNRGQVTQVLDDGDRSGNHAPRGLNICTSDRTQLGCRAISAVEGRSLHGPQAPARNGQFSIVNAIGRICSQMEKLGTGRPFIPFSGDHPKEAVEGLLAMVSQHYPPLPEAKGGAAQRDLLLVRALGMGGSRAQPSRLPMKRSRTEERLPRETCTWAASQHQEDPILPQQGGFKVDGVAAQRCIGSGQHGEICCGDGRSGQNLSQQEPGSRRQFVAKRYVVQLGAGPRSCSQDSASHVTITSSDSDSKPAEKRRVGMKGHCSGRGSPSSGDGAQSPPVTLTSRTKRAIRRPKRLIEQAADERRPRKKARRPKLPESPCSGCQSGESSLEDEEVNGEWYGGHAGRSAMDMSMLPAAGVLGYRLNADGSVLVPKRGNRGARQRCGVQGEKAAEVGPIESAEETNGVQAFIVQRPHTSGGSKGLCHSGCQAPGDGSGGHSGPWGNGDTRDAGVTREQPTQHCETGTETVPEQQWAFRDGHAQPQAVTEHTTDGCQRTNREVGSQEAVREPSVPQGPQNRVHSVPPVHVQTVPDSSGDQFSLQQRMRVGGHPRGVESEQGCRERRYVQGSAAPVSGPRLGLCNAVARAGATEGAIRRIMPPMKTSQQQAARAGQQKAATTRGTFGEAVGRGGPAAGGRHECENYSVG
eukprot:evm.model.scf_2050.2 EVM.evm.TU.scf_2050.2   scf_2050:23587-28251(-)